MVGATLDLQAKERSWVFGLQVRMKTMGADERACGEGGPPEGMWKETRTEGAGPGQGVGQRLPERWSGRRGQDAWCRGSKVRGFKKGSCCWAIDKMRAENSSGMW